jgi:hypothetical protein
MHPVFKHVDKPKLPSESDIQRQFISWLRTDYPDIAPFVFHIPNGGHRTLYYNKFLKEMGLRAGVSDLFVAIPTNNYHGAWIELKSKKGRISPVQEEFLEDMSNKCYFTSVCYSLEEAVITLKNYLNI